jgi:probable HAF family extracellular repeat protein
MKRPIVRFAYVVAVPNSRSSGLVATLTLAISIATGCGSGGPAGSGGNSGGLGGSGGAGGKTGVGGGGPAGHGGAVAGAAGTGIGGARAGNGGGPSDAGAGSAGTGGGSAGSAGGVAGSAGGTSGGAGGVAGNAGGVAGTTDGGSGTGGGSGGGAGGIAGSAGGVAGSAGGGSGSGGGGTADGAAGSGSGPDGGGSSTCAQISSDHAWVDITDVVTPLRVQAISPGEVWGISLRSVQRWDGKGWRTVSDPFSRALPNGWAGNNLGLVRGSSGTNIWITNGSTSIYRWDGAAWTNVPTPASLPAGPNVTDLLVLAPGDAWLVGTNKALYHWDGQLWTQPPFPAGLPTGTGFGLGQMSATGPDDVWISGSPALLHWDGTALSAVSVPSGRRLWAIWANGPNDLWVSTTNLGQTDANVLRYDGTAWSTFASNLFFYAMWGTCPTNVWGVGGGLWHYDGSSWSKLGTYGGLTLSGTGPDDVWSSSDYDHNSLNPTSHLSRWQTTGGGAGADAGASDAGDAGVGDASSDGSVAGVCRNLINIGDITPMAVNNAGWVLGPSSVYNGTSVQTLTNGGGALIMNGSGVVAGWSSGYGNGQTPTVWSTATTPSFLGGGCTPAGTLPKVTLINDAGRVAGVMNRSCSYTAITDGLAFFADPGSQTMTSLGSLGGDAWVVQHTSTSPLYITYPQAMNVSGQIVGYSYLASGAQHAFLWSAGVMTDLGTLGNYNTNSHALAISDDGTIYGTSGAADGKNHVFLWQNGTMQDLFALPSNAGVERIDPAGVVLYSTVTYQNGYVTAVRYSVWQAGTALDIGTLGGSTSSVAGDSGLAGSALVLPSPVVAMNGKGQVVGYSETASGELHPFLWQGGKMWDIGGIPGAATGISENGNIIGYNDDMNFLVPAGSCPPP